MAGQSGTTRDCTGRPDDVMEDGDCIGGSLRDLIGIETCFCWTDACNIDNLLTRNFVVVIFALAYYMIQ